MQPEPLKERPTTLQAEEKKPARKTKLMRAKSGPKPKANPPLTIRQKRLCEEYLIDLNGTQAALRAGYSTASARTIATETLPKPHIQRYLKQLMDERSQRTLISADRVLEEVARIAFASMQDFVEFGPDGVLFKDSARLSYDQMSIISELNAVTTEGKSATTTHFKLKLYAKDTALYHLMRHLGLLEKDTRLSPLKIIVKPRSI